MINGYKSELGIAGYFREGAHSGVDFEGDDGDPVLAAAAGTVVSSISAPEGAGLCVLIEHSCRECEPSTFYTAYCHLQRSLVAAGRPVMRGEKIGEVGHSGAFSGGIAHLHLAMCTYACTFAVRDGRFDGTLDPLDYDVGCFDPDQPYVPADRPILTHPISCIGR